MKFNVAVLAVLAATLAGAPLVVSAADSGSGTTTEAAAPAKAKHHTHHTKKSKKSKSKQVTQTNVAKTTVERVKIQSHSNNIAFTDKRPGVVAKIVEMLMNASADNAITKSYMLEQLGKCFPERDVNKMSSLPLVGMTSTNSSPSLRRSAIRPARKDESYSLKRVFLTRPSLVAKNR